MRAIQDILNFRTDISPFLVHLTKPRARPFPLRDLPAAHILETIVVERRLSPGSSLVSDARFGMYTEDLGEVERQALFSAICFTETPVGDTQPAGNRKPCGGPQSVRLGVSKGAASIEGSGAGPLFQQLRGR